MLKTIHATIVFADLNGFTELVESIKTGEYIDFIYHFRKIIHSAIKRCLNKDALLYGFWGDEVKVILYSPDQEKNVTEAIDFSMSIQKDWQAETKLPFKIGIATDQITLGDFPGAVGYDIEGIPLCTARTLSKLAKQGSYSFIYLDSKSYKLVAKKYRPSFFHFNKKHKSYEIREKI